MRLYRCKPCYSREHQNSRQMDVHPQTWYHIDSDPFPRLCGFGRAERNPQMDIDQKALISKNQWFYSHNGQFCGSLVAQLVPMPTTEFQAVKVQSMQYFPQKIEYPQNRMDFYLIIILRQDPEVCPDSQRVSRHDDGDDDDDDDDDDHQYASHRQCIYPLLKIFQ